MSAASESFKLLRAEMTGALEGRQLVGQLVVIGSGAMYLQGLPRELTYDIDLFVQPELYRKLAGRGWKPLRPNLDQPEMLEWRAGPLPVNAWEESYTPQYGIGGDGREVRAETIRRAVIAGGGWPAQDLQQLREWKLEAGRPKDIEDVRLMDLARGWVKAL